MFRRGRSLSTCPERHLGSVGSVEHIALHTWSGLTGSGDPVSGMPHEFGKLVHALALSHPPQSPRYTVLRDGLPRLHALRSSLGVIMRVATLLTFLPSTDDSQHTPIARCASSPRYQ